LRILIRGYPEEEDEVKAQIVLLSAKVYLQYLLAEKKTAVPVTASLTLQEQKDADQAPNPELENGGWEEEKPIEEEEKKEEDDHSIPKLWQHTLLLSRYTPNYDLRDRTRLYRSLLSTPHTSTDLASLLLLAPKPVPLAPSPSQMRKSFSLGSASLAVGDHAGSGGIKGYEDLPPWVKEGQEPDPALRDEISGKQEYVSGRETSASEKLDGLVRPLAAEKGVPAMRSNGLNKMVGVGKEKTLDDWLDEEEEEEEDSGEEEEESEESSEATGSEEETGSEDESDEGAGLVGR
jgi:AP-3 complex subunit beta